MCGRVRLESDWSELVRIFELDFGDLVDYQPSYNLAPGQRAPLILGPRGDRHAHWGWWGFVPTWERSAKPKKRPINAMADTVATNGFWRGALAYGRCVVPANGFYEWETTPLGKQPYLFARPDRGLLALAGVWARWRPEGVRELVAALQAEGKELTDTLKALVANDYVLDTFAVLTTPPNAVVRRVHDRMPVVLRDGDAVDTWLDGKTDIKRFGPLFQAVPDDFLAARRVNPAMGSWKVDTAEGCAILD